MIAATKLVDKLWREFCAGSRAIRGPLRIVAAAIVLAALCNTPPAYARNFRAQCQADLAHRDVTVTPVTAPYLTRHTLGIAELSAKKTSPTVGEHTLGLTIARLGSDIEYEQNGLKDSDTKEYCMRPRFRVTLSYNPIEVLVAREIPLDSCGYHEVLHHEQRHVAAYREQLGKAVLNVEQAMRAYYGDTIYYGDPERLQNQLKDAVAQRWLPMAQHELAVVDKMHQQIDTPEEYRRNQTACHGELNRILKNSH